ncbi:unnamed protein product [Phytophthora lilii]|uniref:Unnamed protein product n=1 Tax=Phytophthora lilii TaxID=2077276 RepID=A0A9W6WTX8_9STRA|nr:unnamed protein product [Phytophthora lilii]
MRCIWCRSGETWCRLSSADVSTWSRHLDGGLLSNVDYIGFLGKLVTMMHELRAIMVKPWISSRPKAKKEVPGSPPNGATHIGTRALRTTGFGSNLLASLRQKIVRRPKVPTINAAPAPNEAAPAPVATQTKLVFPPSSWGTKQSTAPKPPPSSDEEGSAESEDELGEDGTGLDENSLAKKQKKTRKASKRTSLAFNRWVPKLLNPADKHRDRIHRKKKKHQLIPKGPPVIFTDSRVPYITLLARVLAFLDPLEPARVTAYVNKSTASGVKAFYDIYCPPPRPQRYLVHRLLENCQSVLPAKVMGLLPIRDRVRASASCLSFYTACNSFPLEFEGARAVQHFLAAFDFPRTRHIHKRFSKTPALLFSEAIAEDVVKVIQLLECGGDSEDDDADDDSDCFAAVKEISLRRVNGLSAAKGKYFEQLLQTLIMDHVSSRLHTLGLTDTEMTNQDLQRFIACLSTTPALQNLKLSHNLCSFATLQKLREQIESRALNSLRELHCVATTVDIAAMGYLLEVFQIAPPCCPDLQVVDVSGNPLSNSKAASQLARVFTANGQLSPGWPQLTTLNISSIRTSSSLFLSLSGS